MTAARIFRIALFMSAAPLVMAACNVRYDDNYHYQNPAYRTESALRPNPPSPVYQNQAEEYPAYSNPVYTQPGDPAWIEVYPGPESNSHQADDYAPPQPYPYHSGAIPHAVPPAESHPPALPTQGNEGNGRLPFGLRLDPQGDPERPIRAENLAGDPRTNPSPRDLREARAFTQAQADLYQQGGGIKYRADGSASNPKDVDYISEKRALRIEYYADPALNSADGMPRALDLVIYHLSNRNAFDSLAKSGEGRLTLLEGEEFDPSVKGVDRFCLQPGEQGNWEIDRPEDGKYIAVVAGYPDIKTYVKEYGLGNWTKKGKTDFAVGFGVKTSTEMYMPLPLSLRMDLGAKTMLVLNTDRIYDNLRNVARLTAGEFRYASTAAVFGGKGK